MQLSLHHIAVVVQDVERALPFYKELFALPERPRSTEGLTKNRGAWLQLGAQELHLQERKESPPKSDQHFALLTDDLDGIVRRARAIGARVDESKPIEGIRKRCFVYDPDGNRIELLER